MTYSAKDLTTESVLVPSKVEPRFCFLPLASPFVLPQSAHLHTVLQNWPCARHTQYLRRHLRGDVSQAPLTCSTAWQDTHRFFLHAQTLASSLGRGSKASTRRRKIAVSAAWRSPFSPLLAGLFLHLMHRHLRWQSPPD